MDNAKLIGPYVNAALFCESILQEGAEETGILSVIRMIERIEAVAQFGVHTHEKERFVPPQIPILLHLLVTLRDIPELGGELSVSSVRPSGTRSASRLAQFMKGGGLASGANLKIDLNTLFEESGLYWFEISFDGRLLTKVPLEIHLDVSVIEVPDDSKSQSPET